MECFASWHQRADPHHISRLVCLMLRLRMTKLTDELVHSPKLGNGQQRYKTLVSTFLLICTEVITGAQKSRPPASTLQIGHGHTVGLDILIHCQTGVTTMC